MKYLLLLLISCGVSTSTSVPTVPPISDFKDLADGDIVLQTSRSSQSQAIQFATHSKWSHVGVVLHIRGKAFVYEAHGPVAARTLEAFVSSGVDGKIMARRVRGGLNTEQLQLLNKVGRTFAGKPYDAYFNWDDSQIYCSELVYKMFDRALNIKVGRLQKLGDMDLSSPIVKQKLKERYGDDIPYGETVLTPAAIANDNESLQTIYQN